MLIEPASKVSVPLVDVTLTRSSVPERVFAPVTANMKVPACEKEPVSAQMFEPSKLIVKAPYLKRAAEPSPVASNPLVDATEVELAPIQPPVPLYPVVSTPLDVPS